MGTEQENHPFEWLSGNGGNGPVFPIDYSQRSFAEYLGRDPRQVKRYLIDHPFFRDILQEQFCKNQGNGKFPNRSDNAIISIPAESAVFFNCFYELVITEKYHAAFCSGDHDIPDEILAQFLHDLCREISLSIEGNAEKGNQYSRHVLYKNEVFRQKLLSDLWAQELEPRVKKIRELSKTAIAENQLESLMDCILCLDRNIINLQIASQHEDRCPSKKAGENRNVSSSKTAIRKLLTDLLQRNRTERENVISPFDTYLVDNVALGEADGFDGIHTLQDAFHVLSHLTTKQNSDLETFARKNYLEHLGKKEPVSEFEEKYLQAAQYLNIRNEAPEDLLQRLVAERVKQYCGSILDQCCITPDCSVPPIGEEFSQFSYIAQLVDHLVYSVLSPIYYHFIDVLNLTSCMFMADYVSKHNEHRMHYILKQINRDLPYDPFAVICPAVEPEENWTLKDAESFAELFSTAWQYLYGEAVLDPEKKHFLDLEAAAHRIYTDGQIGAVYFDRAKYFPFTLENVQEMLLTYEEIISTPNQYHEYAKLLCFAPELLYFVLLTVYKRQADIRVPQIIECVKMLLKTNM